MSLTPITYNWPVLDTDGIVVNTQLAPGIRTFTFNGELATSPGAITLPLINRTISFKSTDDLSAITFSISGYDSNGIAISENLSGPNNTTVYSSKYYNIIASISVDIDMTGHVDIGTGTTGYTAWFYYNMMAFNSSLAVQTDRVATINYTFQTTLYSVRNFNNEDIVTASIISDMTSATSNEFDFTTCPMYACRVFINSSNSTGQLIVNILQQG